MDKLLIDPATQRRDNAAAALARRTLENAREKQNALTAMPKSPNLVSSYMTRGNMKITSPNFTVNLGTIDIAQKRREAWEKAVKRDNVKSLGDWIKRLCDKASGFEEQKAK